MKKDDEAAPDDTTIPHGKRTARDGGAPESQPGEFADDVRVNRFTPPPPPEIKHDK